MKAPLKTHRTSDLDTRYTKCSKKSKGAKKFIEKNNIDLRPKDSDPAGNSTEVIASEIEVESLNLKKNSLDLRKNEASEWKFLKKIDCQRLETVLEEGQISSEERILKNCENFLLEESDEEIDDEFNLPEIETKFFSFAEVLDTVEEEEETPPEVENPNPESRKGDCQHEAPKVDPAEVTSSRSKKGFFPAIPKERMEILPIFSNNKFHCSRDAISIGECEDLFTAYKNTTAFVATENKKEVKLDRKDIHEGESNGMSIPPKLAPTSTFVLRFKAFTEKYVPQTSSPFINSLLVLAPFSEERKMLLNINDMAEEKLQPTKSLTSDTKIGSTDLSVTGEEGTNTRLANIVENNTKYLRICVIISSAFGFISFLLALVWQNYEPPCLMDHILGFIPCFRRRRTCFQLFLDRMLQLLASVVNFCKSSDTDISVFCFL